jgi:SAM-dependent methyltransferase
MPGYVDYSEYYDLDHDITLDLDFYRAYARISGSPILELACGTGRVALPLAEAGFEIHGMDISENMLEVCRRKVSAQGLGERIQLIQADMAQFELPKKNFRLAFIALRSFMHLLEPREQLSCLECVHNHLRPEGTFILSVIAPAFERLSQKPGPFILQREFDLPNGNRVLRYGRLVEHDPIRQVRQFEFRFEEYDSAGMLIHGRTLPLYTRYTFRYELEYLLKRARFKVLEVFRDYDRNPYDGTGEMIVVSHKVGSKQTIIL